MVVMEIGSPNSGTELEVMKSGGEDGVKVKG